MKKARLILTAVTLLAFISGMLAFKTSRFNGLRAYTYANVYTTLGKVFTRATSTFVPVNPARFFTTTGTEVTTAYSAPNVGLGIVTFTEIGGSQTITFPEYIAFEIEGTFTTLVN